MSNWGIPWNKGLTKETDERVAKVGQKVSKKLKGKSKSPEHRKKIGDRHRGRKYPKELYPILGWRGRPSWNKNLTKETDERLRKVAEKLRKPRPNMRGKLRGNKNPSKRVEVRKKISDKLTGKKYPASNYPNRGTRGKTFPKELYPNHGGRSHSLDYLLRLAFEARTSQRKNRPNWFMNTPFDSASEKDIAKHLFLKYGITPEEGISCHIRIGRGEIDFRLFGIIFLEYHPWDLNLTKEEYYNKRRKLLDKNGYKDFPLIIIKSSKELEQTKKILKSFEVFEDSIDLVQQGKMKVEKVLVDGRKEVTSIVKRLQGD